MDLRLCWEEEDRLVLSCGGELSWDSTELLLNKVRVALQGRVEPQVIIDLDAVDCITSAGIGGLLQLRKLVTDSSGVVVMARLSPTIMRLFKTVGLDRHVPLLDTLDQARGLLSKRIADATACPAVPAV